MFSWTNQENWPWDNKVTMSLLVVVHKVHGEGERVGGGSKEHNCVTRCGEMEPLSHRVRLKEDKYMYLHDVKWSCLLLPTKDHEIVTEK